VAANSLELVAQLQLRDQREEALLLVSRRVPSQRCLDIAKQTFGVGVTKPGLRHEHTLEEISANG
jgi:hypothetical protein